MGFDVEVLVIVPPYGYIENGQAISEQARRDLTGLPVEIAISKGKPVDIILEKVQQNEYSLLIFDKNRLQNDAFGMTVMNVFWKRYDFPILITENAKPGIQNILLCSAGANGDLLQTGAELAQALEAKITLLHVAAGSVPSMYTGLEEFDETVPSLLQADTPFARHLRKGVNILSQYKVASEIKIRHGVPVDELVRETQLENYDLVVIGHSHVQKGLKERLLGNLTAKIIDMIELPILVVGKTLQN